MPKLIVEQVIRLTAEPLVQATEKRAQKRISCTRGIRHVEPTGGRKGNAPIAMNPPQASVPEGDHHVLDSSLSHPGRDIGRARIGQID